MRTHTLPTQTHEHAFGESKPESPHESALARTRFDVDETPRTIYWPPPRTNKPLDEQPTDRMWIDPHLDSAAAHRYHDLLAAVPIAIVGLDAAGRVEYWSPNATQLLGWRPEEVIGHQPLFVPTERFTEHHRILTQAHAGVPVRDLLTHRRHRDGSRLTLMLSASPTDSGGVVMTLRSASEQHPFSQAIPTAVAPSVRQMETLGRLATGLTQEFTTLVAAISESADLLADWLPPKTAGREHAELIRAAVRHAARLTHQVVSYARPTSLAAGEVDLAEVLYELDGLLRAAAGTSVQCVIRADDRLPRAWGDRSRIDRILLELVVQAREAMPDGGTLAIRSSLEVMGPECEGWPLGQPAGEYLCITVSDTGHASDDAVVRSSFVGSLAGPVAQTRMPSIAGWQSILEATADLQGVIISDPAVTIGHVYRVYLPAVRRWRENRAAEVSLGSAMQTVLLVDDDDDARNFAKTVLEMSGLNVIEARGGDEAELFARLAQEPIDVVVTDVVMPGMGGRRLVERLRCSRPGLPAVYVSAYPSAGEPLDTNTLFIAKPYMMSDLLSAVAHVTRTAIAL